MQNEIETTTDPDAIREVACHPDVWPLLGGNAEPSTWAPRIGEGVCWFARDGVLLMFHRHRIPICATLPATIQSAEYALGVIDQLLESPGRSMITGGSSLWQTAKIPGTESANAKALLDQIQGQAFLEAFDSLKGSGQITEVEGNKATQAKARLSTAQTDEEFESALRELRGVVERGLENARRKATSVPNTIRRPDAGDSNVVDWNELP